MGCWKVLLVGRAHLSGICKGTLLAVIMLDADDYLFDVVCTVVKEDKEEWYSFFSVLSEYLGGLKLVIMSDRHDGLLYAVPRVLGAKNHSYYLRHSRENFVKWPQNIVLVMIHVKSLLKRCYAPT